LIRAAIFDYGETLVWPKDRDGITVPRAMRASYAAFAQAGLKMAFAEFAAIDMSVFKEYGQLEAKENRDIPDIIKYHELAGRLFPAKSEARRKRIARQANMAFWDVVARNYSAIEGARTSLSRLESMGLKMAVLSNHHSQQALVEHLKHLELDRYFQRIFSSARLGVRKPDPRAFEKCLSALRVGGDETVFVGDSIKNDMAGAKACGMRTILFEREPKRADPSVGKGKGRTQLKATFADFTVGRLEDVPQIIGRLNEP
jgi:HAD superfamily hydrolase (TIGR01662 family)